MKHRIYQNRKILALISFIIILTGALLGYFKFGEEPWETIGGFLCGTGLVLVLVFMFMKKPN